MLIVESDILRTIEKIKVNKAPGPDKITPRILMEIKNQICKPLSIVFNKSLTAGKVPSDWKLANYIFEVFDENRSVDIIYLDSQKTFDKVPHRRLLSKLLAHGISGNIHNWLVDWLSERKQRVGLTVLHQTGSMSEAVYLKDQYLAPCSS